MGWVSRADEMGHVYIRQVPAYGTADSRSSARLSVRRAINLCRPSLLYLSPFSSFPLPAPTPPLPQPLRPSPPALPLPCGEPPLRLARRTEPHTEPTCRPNDRVAVFAYPLPLPPALSGHFASRFFPHRHTRIDSAAVTQSLPLVLSLSPLSTYTPVHQPISASRSPCMYLVPHPVTSP